MSTLLQGIIAMLVDTFESAAISKTLEAGVSVWNFFASKAFELLSVTPQDFKEGSVWSYIRDLNPVFVAIGTSLLSMFTLYTFCMESINIRREINMDNIIRILVSYIFALAMVMNSMEFIEAVFSVTASIARWLGGSYIPMTVNENLESYIEGSLIMWLLSIIVLIIMVVLGITLLFTVYFRFFKLYMIVPLGPVAMSTLVGSGSSLGGTGAAYIKTLLAYSMEIIIMALALNIGVNLASNGIGITMGDNSLINFILLSGEMIFTMGMLVGAVKGAENILRHALGL